VYGNELAGVYDLVHEGRGKDYAAEAALLASVIRERLPGARTLLDVACGTGSHLRPLARLFDEVEGIELAEAMIDAARATLPDIRLHHADMRSFDLGRTFDALTCMFGSIGYMSDEAELDRALACFARHVRPGGVVAIDPWWFAETFTDGYIAADVVEAKGRTISRVSHSARRGTKSHMDVHFIVADPVAGARHFVDTHIISLFSRKQYERAFTLAGLAVEYIPGVQAGRGLFVGVRRSRGRAEGGAP
jgi:SAM-dependent methyltransferase